MTSEAFDHLRSQILTLSESERAELARDLITSLDAPGKNSGENSKVKDAWGREIQRRIAVIDSDQAKLLDRDEFRKRMRARIARR